MIKEVYKIVQAGKVKDLCIRQYPLHNINEVIRLWLTAMPLTS